MRVSQVHSAESCGAVGQTDLRRCADSAQQEPGDAGLLVAQQRGGRPGPDDGIEAVAAAERTERLQLVLPDASAPVLSGSASNSVGRWARQWQCGLGGGAPSRSTPHRTRPRQRPRCRTGRSARARPCGRICPPSCRAASRRPRSRPIPTPSGPPSAQHSDRHSQTSPQHIKGKWVAAGASAHWRQCGRVLEWLFVFHLSSSCRHRPAKAAGPDLPDFWTRPARISDPEGARILTHLTTAVRAQNQNQ